jgi:hypothetical protein
MIYDYLAEILVEYIIVPTAVIYYSVIRSRTFHNAKYLSQYLHHMTWFKILQLKQILDRKTENIDFDNVRIQTLYSWGVRRIGFFKGNKHLLSVYSTELWPRLNAESIVFDLQPKHPFSFEKGYSIHHQESWNTMGIE